MILIESMKQKQLLVFEKKKNLLCYSMSIYLRICSKNLKNKYKQLLRAATSKKNIIDILFRES
jgi:hypothetical protein